VAGDIRAQTGPGAAAQAPVTLIYVADASATSAQVDTGFIGQNVYLFAASEGLNAWFRAINAAALGEALKLPPEKRVLYAQSVGYPPNP
jgi:nitroreductase